MRDKLKHCRLHRAGLAITVPSPQRSHWHCSQVFSESSEYCTESNATRGKLIVSERIAKAVSITCIILLRRFASRWCRIAETADPLVLYAKYAPGNSCIVFVIVSSKQIKRSELVDHLFHDSGGHLRGEEEEALSLESARNRCAEVDVLLCTAARPPFGRSCRR